MKSHMLWTQTILAHAVWHASTLPTWLVGQAIKNEGNKHYKLIEYRRGHKAMAAEAKIFINTGFFQTNFNKALSEGENSWYILANSYSL